MPVKSCSKIFYAFTGSCWIEVICDDTEIAPVIVLEIKFERVRWIAGLAEIVKTSYFAEFLHFGATGRRCGEDHFFSPAQYSRL